MYKVLVVKPAADYLEDVGIDRDIKMDPQEMCWVVLDCIELAQVGTSGRLL
jgi:hypothetical protein